MKEKYFKPQSDVQEFNISDIVTTSENPTDDNDKEWGA